MIAYVVKHLVEDHGPLAKIMSDVKRTPFSYTSKKNEAEGAARGRDVYVVEVRSEDRKRSYWLGYRYKAREAFKLAGGLWEGEFEFKNSATPGVTAEGLYFDSPARIDDAALNEWLSTKQPGMASIPTHLIPALDAVFRNPANDAQRFV